MQNRWCYTCIHTYIHTHIPSQRSSWKVKPFYTKAFLLYIHIHIQTHIHTCTEIFSTGNAILCKIFSIIHTYTHIYIHNTYTPAQRSSREATPFYTKLLRRWVSSVPKEARYTPRLWFLVPENLHLHIWFPAQDSCTFVYYSWCVLGRNDQICWATSVFALALFHSVCMCTLLMQCFRVVERSKRLHYLWAWSPAHSVGTCCDVCVFRFAET
jgi:hypothetical protein